MSVGPQNPFSNQLHAEKYREPNETFRDAMGRIAGALKDDDAHFHRFRDILLDMRFMPAGRVQAAMGAARRVTAFNCFVAPTIADSFVDGSRSIMKVAELAATTMRMGGGIGYDFSTLRPRGALIKKLLSNSSGPLGFMPIFDAVCKATSSAGNRRGAQMGVLRIDHPDIMEFIRAKQPGGQVQVLWDLVEEMPDSPQRRAAVFALQQTLDLTGFNVSVAITDEFMNALAKGGTYKLRFGSKIMGEADALTTWDALMRSTWDWAEPGVLFIDTINRTNPLYYCEKIAATNPCFTGDTKVWTADGHKTFAELAQTGADVQVLTELDCGNLVYRTMHNPRVTQKDVTLVRVTFDNGISVRCTPEHRFFLRNKVKGVRAADLHEGDSIQSAYRYKANSKGYLRISNGLVDPLEHHIPFEGIVGLGSEFEVHHRNEVKSDNRPDNLIVLDAIGHRRLHMCSDRNPSVRFPERNKLIQMDHSGKNNGRYREDIDDVMLADLRSSGMSYAAIASKVGCSKFTVMKRLGWNHKVVSVEYILEREDVYCGTVAETSRFFVALGDDDGVLVSNCGEQPLPPNGACLLGSFNLIKYVSPTREFEWEQLRADVAPVVAAMDNVIDRTIYPLAEQEQEAVNKRRMGLGITALANAGETLGYPYGSPAFIHFQAKVLDLIRDEAYRASAYLAKAKGSFPLYDEHRYCDGEFFKTLAADVQDLIRKIGLRNSHLLSIAPTGTISMAADNTSSSIEPVFALETRREVLMSDGKVSVDLPDYAFGTFGTQAKTADQVSIDEHLAVLLTASNRVDSAVSKTCNVPANIGWGDFKSVYTRAYEGGAKGCTTFNIGGKRTGIMVAKPQDGAPTCEIDLTTGRRSCE